MAVVRMRPPFPPVRPVEFLPTLAEIDEPAEKPAKTKMGLLGVVLAILAGIVIVGFMILLATPSSKERAIRRAFDETIGLVSK